MRWMTLFALFLVAGSLQAAQVLSIDSSPLTNDGTYDAGSTITIRVHFNSSVTLGADPKLLLSVGRVSGDDAFAYAASGQTGVDIDFDYVVRAGDNSTDLDYATANALSGITGMSGNLPAPGSAGSLGSNATIIVDTAPLVRSVSTTLGGGTYGIGQIIPVTVQFSEPVVLAGTGASAQIALQLNSSTTTATYVSGSGTSQLQFAYSVTSGQTAAHLDYASTSALTLSGTGPALLDGGGKTATLTLPTGGSSTLRAIIIDGTSPTVTSITSTTTNGSYKAGDSIPITVQFSEVITVTGSPALTLNTTGGATGSATYVSGSNSTNLLFTYLVGASQISSDLDVISLNLTSSSITDSIGNPATSAVPTGSTSNGALAKNKAIVIALPPTITSVVVTTPSTPGTIITGGTATITVTFSGTPTGNGATLKLETGAVDRDALFTSISGSNVLFTYTVQAGDNTPKLDYTSINALTIGGLIVDGFAGATFTLPALGGGSSLAAGNIRIDTTPTPLAAPSFTLTPAALTSSTVPVTVAVVASEAVTNFTQTDLACTNCTASLSGSSPTFSASLTPVSTLYAGLAASAGSSVIRLKARSGSITLSANMPLQIGSTTMFVATAVSVTTALTDVTLKDALSAGLAINTDVWLPSGETMQLSIPVNAAQDLAGNNSVASSMASVIYDPTPPIATVTAPANYSSPLVFTINFSENVSTLAASGLTASNGTLGLLSQITAKQWTVAITPIASGNVGLQVKSNAVLDQALSPNPTSTMISFIPLAVTQIATNPVTAQAYGVGGVIDLILTLNRTVVFAPSSIPATLLLETGAVDHQASLFLPAASSTNTLTFRYTVVTGDSANDLDVTSVSALNLQGGTIDSLPTLTVPAPGTTGSLSVTSTVTIDSTKPQVTLSTPTITGSLKATMIVSFDEPIAATGSVTFGANDFTVPTGVSADAPVVASDGLSATIGFNVPTTTVEVSYIVSLKTGAVADLAGNTSTDTPSATIVYDPVTPVLTLSTTLGDKATSPLSVTISASKYVTGMATNDCNVTNGVASSMNTAIGTSFTASLTPTATLKLGQAAAVGVNTIRLQAVGGDVTVAAGTVLRLVDTGGFAVVRLSTTSATTVTSVGVNVGIESILPAAFASGSVVWPANGLLVTMSVRANACVDLIGQNNSAAATPIAVRYDPTSPMFRIAPPATLAANGTAVFTLTPSEPVSGLTAAKVTTDGVVQSVAESADRLTWTVTVTPVGATSVSLAVAANAATDGAGNPSLAEAAVVFSIKPQITKIGADNANGTYTPGTRLVVRVTFSEAVQVSGVPELLLNLTPSGRAALYTSGTRSKELLFDYTIVDGDATTDLDYTSTTALSLPNGAFIADIDSGNNASLTLAAPGQSGSIAAAAAIVVNDGGASGPAKPGISDQPAGSGGCGAGSGIAVLLAGGWLGLGLSRRRRRAA